MKIRNPRSRHHLKIKKSWKVLEIGGGHNPHPRANVVVDKYIDNNAHRGGDLKVYEHQKFMQADAENLPFDDNEFDYVICCHVLEHAENPEKFVKEMSRVAKRGYLEVPSLIGEYLVPKYSHEWCTVEIEGQVVLKSKADIDFPKEGLNFGDLFLYYLNSKSLPFKMFLKTTPSILTVNYEWENEVPLLVNSNDPKIDKYFSGAWSLEMIEKQMPQRSIAQDGFATLGAFFEILSSYSKSVFTGRTSQSFEQIGLGETNKYNLAVSESK